METMVTGPSRSTSTASVSVISVLPVRFLFDVRPSGVSERYKKPLVIAGLDPATRHFSKKMDTRVKPAYDDGICTCPSPRGREEGAVEFSPRNTAIGLQIAFAGG